MFFRYFLISWIVIISIINVNCGVIKSSEKSNLSQNKSDEISTRKNSQITENKEKDFNKQIHYTFIILGATGDLAKKKIYPTIWQLFKKNLLPAKTIFVGSARRSLTIQQLRDGCHQYMDVKLDEQEKYEEFWKLNYYIAGSSTDEKIWPNFNEKLENYENNSSVANRLFYLALPPNLFEFTATNIKKYSMSTKGWTRIIIEKPFGRDSETSESLSKHLNSLFDEDQVYKMDHYLGKEMVQNLITFRFANRIFNPSWNRHNIASVQIKFSEPFGTEGRGIYFDDAGIIRDVMQNHMLQILSLITMEKPISKNSNDIRDEKVKVLKSIKSVELNDVVLGQYVGDPDAEEADAKLGYRDDPTVPANSTTPTFAMVLLKINNQRWSGVPFLLKCGKALNEHKVEVRIQYLDVFDNIFGDKVERNELVITIHTNERLHVKITTKTPGITSDIEENELDFPYENKYKNLTVPGAYERLILDVFNGSQMNFVRTDELSEEWRIFTPLLHRIENEKIQPIFYKFKSRGPKEADKLAEKNNFKNYDL